MSETARNTAETISFFDDLFDSVNGASLRNKTNRGKPLRQAVTEKSPHHSFWEKAIVRLKNTRFVDNAGKESFVPSLKNFIQTIESYQRVWQFLKKKNIKVMRPRYFNSDPIENLFGQVRAYNFRNNNPDCHTFKSTFRALLITRLIQFHSDSYNCEEDSGEQVVEINALKKMFKKYENNDIDEPSDSPESAMNQTQLQTSSQERQKIHSRTYTTGWVIRKVLSKVNNCAQCEKNLTTSESHCAPSEIQNWVKLKEYESLKVKKLTYPSEQAVRLFGVCTEETNKYLEYAPQKNNIKKKIKENIKSKYLFDFFSCEVHKSITSDLFLELAVKLCIFNWCNIINRILKGTDVFRLQNKTLPLIQNKAFIKYKTKLKNKKK